MLVNFLIQSEKVSTENFWPQIPSRTGPPLQVHVCELGLSKNLIPKYFTSQNFSTIILFVQFWFISLMNFFTFIQDSTEPSSSAC